MFFIRFLRFGKNRNRSPAVNQAESNFRHFPALLLLFYKLKHFFAINPTFETVQVSDFISGKYSVSSNEARFNILSPLFTAGIYPLKLPALSFSARRYLFSLQEGED